MDPIIRPTGVVRLAVVATRRSWEVATWGERQWFRYLASRIDAANPVELPAKAITAPGAEESLAPLYRQPSLGARLKMLVDASVAQSVADGREAVYSRLLNELVPDEARILSALSDGASSPAVTVSSRSRTGGIGEVVLDDMCLVGRTANLALPRLTPSYIANLRRLGLVETAAEDPALKVEYEILEADPIVLAASKRGARGPIPARVDRSVVVMTELGNELWAAATSQKA